MELKKSNTVPIKKKSIRFSEIVQPKPYRLSKGIGDDHSDKNSLNCEYEMETESIGQGNFGVVYKGIDCETGDIVAIKQILLHKLTKTMITKFLAELDLAVTLYHKNVLRSFKKLQTERHLYIISEYCDEGTLVEAITALKLIHNPEERENKVKAILVQLKDAMKYLADIKILHRDIKPANVLFKKENGEIVLKLADFGFSKFFDINFEDDKNIKNTMVMSVCGSPIYMAPEMILNKKPSVKSDLWSFGVVMYEMLYGWNPYNSPTTWDMLAKRMMSQEIDFDNIFSEDCISLLKSLLSTDPEKRIGWKDFFKSNWFSEPEKMTVENDESIPFQIDLNEDEILSVDEDADFIIKNKERIIPKTITKNKLYSSSPTLKSVAYDFDDDYIFVNKDNINSSTNEIYQSYSGSYIRIVSGLSSYWPFSKSY